MLSPENVKIKKDTEKNGRTIFKIGPLPNGYGHTLGNSLRRVLLSSIMGAAPTRVAIKGASHEFDTIEGIKEDAFTILQNIKNIRFSIESKDFDEVKLEIKKTGVGEVKASDIVAPSNVKISNPDQVICTITDKKVSFEAEIFAKNGYGYVPSEEARKEDTKEGVIYLDSSFSPIKFVNYTVGNTRFGKQTELDEVSLEVETDGSVPSEEAVKKASAMLRDFYGKLAEGEAILIEKEENEEVIEETVDEQSVKAREIQIDELNLPTRTINALKKHNIKTLKDLAEMDEDRLLSVRNLGEKSIQEIKKLLKKEGLTE